MDPDVSGDQPDAAAPAAADVAPEAESPPEATPEATAAPPPQAQPQTAPDPQAQTQPRIDPNEYEYLRRQNDELATERRERQRRDEQQQRAFADYQVNARLEQRSQAAREQARAMRAYDEDAADRLIAETEKQNRDFLIQYNRQTQQQYEQRLEAERRAASVPAYARDWAAHYELPPQYADALAGLPPEQIPNQAYLLALATYETKKARYDAEQERRRVVAGRMASSRAGTAPASAGGVPATAPVDGSFAQLRGAMQSLAPDIYDKLTE